MYHSRWHRRCSRGQSRGWKSENTDSCQFHQIAVVWCWWVSNLPDFRHFIWDVKMCFAFFLLIFIFWMCSMWDLSSPTRDQTCARCLRSTVVNIGPPGKSLFYLLIKHLLWGSLGDTKVRYWQSLLNRQRVRNVWKVECCLGLKRGERRVTWGGVLGLLFLSGSESRGAKPQVHGLKSRGAESKIKGPTESRTGEIPGQQAPKLYSIPALRQALCILWDPRVRKTLSPSSS